MVFFIVKVTKPFLKILRNCEVREPDLARCAKRKDFGQEFYLTTSKEQAESFLRTSIVKAIATGKIEEGQNFGYVSTFEFQPVGKLEMHVFNYV